jgi:GST-like protein
MIELFTWPTPNGHKVHIMLEECGLPYNVHPIDIGKGDQFQPEFLRISPNNKMPAMIDTDGPDGKPYSVFESGAMLMYLAEKTGRFIPRDTRGRYDVIQWLMFQMGGVGPMLGQAHHFRDYAPEKIPYAIDRYTNEATRLYGVIDRRLGESEWIAGDDYSIADMAIFPWLRPWKAQGQNLDEMPNVKRWLETMAARPAVKRGLEVLRENRRKGAHSKEAWETLFGKGQYKRGYTCFLAQIVVADDSVRSGFALPRTSRIGRHVAQVQDQVDQRRSVMGHGAPQRAGEILGPPDLE